jgi:cobalt-zinc-cadmium resistance protein CzcA
MSNSLAAIPGVTTNFSQVIQDNGGVAVRLRGEIVAKISGNNLDVLESKAQQLVDVIQAIPGATDVEATHIGGQSEVVVTPDRGRLARYGITIGDVNNLVNEALSGAAVTATTTRTSVSTWC